MGGLQCRKVLPQFSAGRRGSSRARVQRGGYRARRGRIRPQFPSGRRRGSRARFRRWRMSLLRVRICRGRGPGWCRQRRRDDPDPLLARTKSKASRLPPTSLVTCPGAHIRNSILFFRCFCAGLGKQLGMVPSLCVCLCFRSFRNRNGPARPSAAGRTRPARASGSGRVRGGG